MSWGQAWGNSWGFIGAPTIYYQRGGGLPTISRRRHERERELSDALDATMRELFWQPIEAAALAATQAATQHREHVRRVETTTRTLLESRARQEEEQDDEEWVLMQ